MTRPQEVAIPVLCIGNITTGGTGKTPSVIYVTRELQKLGFKPGVVSRGYKGTKSKEGGVVTDGAALFMSAVESGDEPAIIAANCGGVPVAIGRDRKTSIETLMRRYQVEVIVTDDGFQDNSLRKDVSIVMIDAMKPFGNGCVLPVGDLREPKSALKRSDIVIVSRIDLVPVNRADAVIRNVVRAAGKDQVYRMSYAAECLVRVNDGGHREPLTVLDGKKVLLIAGIGNPRSFYDLIQRHGPETMTMLSYADHYHYRDAECVRFEKISRDVDYVLMTEKDYCKVRQHAFSDNVYYVRISAVVDRAGEFMELVAQSLRKGGPR